MTNDEAAEILQSLLSSAIEARNLYGSGSWLEREIEPLELAIAALTRKPLMSDMWRPIKDAPKDRRLLLCRISASGESLVWGEGHWEPQRNSKKPNPFWRWHGISGVEWHRENQPTHFIEIEGPR